MKKMVITTAFLWATAAFLLFDYNLADGKWDSVFYVYGICNVQNSGHCLGYVYIPLVLFIASWALYNSVKIIKENWKDLFYLSAGFFVFFIAWLTVIRLILLSVSLAL